MDVWPFGGIVAGKAETTGTPSYTLTVPVSAPPLTGTVVAGDLLILAVNANNLDTPAGFTFIDSAFHAGGTENTTWVFYKVASGGETEVDVNVTAGNQAGGVLAALKASALIDEVDHTDGTTGDDITIVNPQNCRLTVVTTTFAGPPWTSSAADEYEIEEQAGGAFRDAILLAIRRGGGLVAGSTYSADGEVAAGVITFAIPMRFNASPVDAVFFS